MLVAAWTVHRANGFFIVKEGWECNLVLAAAAAAVAVPAIALALGLGGGIGQLAIFDRPSAT